MDFRDSPEEADFRARLRTWVAGNIPPGGFRPADQERNSFDLEWHRILYKAGWMGLSWPKSVGGQELGPMYDAILNEELGAAGAPRPPSIGFLGTGDTAVRHARATGAVPARTAERDVPVVSGIQRARRGLGSSVTADAGGQNRRRIRRQRAESLDEPGAVVGLLPAARAQRSGIHPASRPVMLRRQD